MDGKGTCDTEVMGILGVERVVGVTLDGGNVGGFVGGIDGSGGCLMVVAV